MSEEKQIEEMAKVLDINLPLLDCEAWRCDGCRYEKYRNMCDSIKQAEVLYNAGYRKQSEGTWEKSDIPGEKYACSECGGACWYYDYEGEVAKSRFCPPAGRR